MDDKIETTIQTLIPKSFYVHFEFMPLGKLWIQFLLHSLPLTDKLTKPPVTDASQWLIEKEGALRKTTLIVEYNRMKDCYVFNLHYMKICE